MFIELMGLQMQFDLSKSIPILPPIHPPSIAQELSVTKLSHPYYHLLNTSSIRNITALVPVIFLIEKGKFLL